MTETKQGGPEKKVTPTAGQQSSQQTKGNRSVWQDMPSGGWGDNG